MRNLVNFVILLSDHHLNQEVYMNFRYFRTCSKIYCGTKYKSEHSNKAGFDNGKNLIIHKLTSFFFFIFNRHILTQASNEPPKNVILVKIIILCIKLKHTTEKKNNELVVLIFMVHFNIFCATRFEI